MSVELPPPTVTTISIQGPQAAGAGAAPQVPLQAAQPPPQIPQVDLVVEVVGQLPLQARLQDVTRLLGRRQLANRSNRRHLPTILELIMLVERNPVRPPGRNWDSVGALTVGYDAKTTLVTVEYCVERCTHDPNTGAFDPKRRLVSYSAPEKKVASKLNKKLRDLQKYAER